MSRGAKWLVGVLGAVALIGIALVAGWQGFVRSHTPRSFPQVSGEIRLDGLDGPVDVYRDGMGVPHIYASTLHDLFLAQGYVHAQDRFWQMDFWRHVGSAQLSEMFGSGRVETDAFLRTLGWRHIAEAEWQGLSDQTRSILSAYAEGVNAYLADRQGSQLSLEYAILGIVTPSYKPVPWTPIHSLTWGKVMAWDLGGNMNEEIARAVLLKTLSPEQVDELFPPYPADHPIIVTEPGDMPSAQGGPLPSGPSIPEELLATTSINLGRLDTVLGEGGSEIGSNSWVIGGSRTASGKPLLANDPHLSIQMPSIWYQVDLQCRPRNNTCPFSVAGFSFAGVPGVVIGHNDRIAWGFTNLGPDVMDLYIERVNPANPGQYEDNGEWVDFETRAETINMGGGEPVTITVRATRHGPVISDTYGPLKDEAEGGPEITPFSSKAGIELPEDYLIALRWTALEPSRLFDAIVGLNLASDFEEFRQAAREFSVPPQNLVFADVDGNIGYQMPGNIPIRVNGDGRLPVPGWTDDHEWQGYIPFDDLPYAYNPSADFIAAVNNQAAPSDYPYLITTDWDYGFRAQRVVDLIVNAPGKIDTGYVRQMQGDDFDSNAALLVPILLHLELDDSLAAERELLEDWDYQARIDSRPAALFEAFWVNLLSRTFHDDLPEDYWPEGGDRWSEVMRNLADKPESSWWDDLASDDVVETRDEVFAAAFDGAVAELRKEYGSDVDQWPGWGELHSAVFRNASLGESGVPPIEALFNRGPFAAGGGSSIVNATGWDANEPYEVAWLPSMRFIADLSDLGKSLTVHTTGQSGHAGHAHYIDMADMWRNIEYYPMLWIEEAVISSAESHLSLLP
jgi:penicillin amidase